MRRDTTDRRFRRWADAALDRVDEFHNHRRGVSDVQALSDVPAADRNHVAGLGDWEAGRRCLVLPLVAVGPGADAYLVAFRVRQGPERPGEGIIDEPAAGGQGGTHPGLCLVVGHRDVEMDPVSLCPRAVHLLEPDGGELPGGIDDGTLAVVVAA